MNWEAISAIGQIVGAIAVVISLIYLATEVRSSAHATQLAARRSTLDSLHRLILQVTEHADLAELRNRGVRDYESLEGTDLARFDSYMHGVFRTAEDVYYLHLRGHLDAHLWYGLEAVLRDVNTALGVQAWWRSHSHWFRGEEFVNFINQLQQNSQASKVASRTNGK